MCPSLRPTRGKEKTSSNSKAYAFDITKAYQIFDILIRDKQLKLLDGHKIPSVEEIKSKNYCKYHHKFGHLTNNCVHFRDLIQQVIQDGRLKFKEKTQPTVKVNLDPFEVNSSFAEPMYLSINMVDVKEELDLSTQLVRRNKSR